MADESNNPIGGLKRVVTHAEVFRHVLTTIELSDEALEVLQRNGIVTIQCLRLLPLNQMDNFINDENIPFTMGDKLAIEAFQFWLRTYNEENNDENPMDWINQFTEKEFDNATRIVSKPNNPTNATPSRQLQTPLTLNTPNPTVSTTHTNGGTENPNTKASIKDYPRFNGSLEKWREFKHQFKAAAEIHGYGRILNPNYVVPSPFDHEYGNFEMANNLFFQPLPIILFLELP